MLVFSKWVHLLFDIVSHSLDLLNAYLRRVYVLPLVVRKEANGLILLDQMSIVLNEVQQNTVTLLRFCSVVVLHRTFGVEYSSVCVKSFPFDANIFWQQIASVDVFVNHVDVVIQCRLRTVQVKVVLHDTNKCLQVFLLLLIEFTCNMRQVLLLGVTRKPRVEWRLGYVKP